MFNKSKSIMHDKEFKIRFSGGFGDCLRMISLQSSLLEHHKRNGIKIYWVYSNQNLIDLVYNKFKGATINSNWVYVRDYDLIDYNNEVSAIDLGYPTHQTLYDFLQLFDYFELVSQEQYEQLKVSELSNWRCDHYPSFDESKQLRGLYDNEVLGLDINLSEKEQHEINSLLNDTSCTFCVQLSGRDHRKKYSDENYIKVFKLIFEKYPSSKIFLIDQPKNHPNSELLFDDRIVDLIGKLSIRQLAKLIQDVDYLISPDSYAKYLRNWVNKPQTILSADVSYRTSNDDFLILNDCFHSVNLLLNDKIKVLGATYEIKKNKLIKGKLTKYINDITPKEIADSIYIGKKLVTVTCKRDLNQMILQSHSIDKFVTEKCEHHVFIEDNELPLSKWEEILKPFYSKHRLILHKTDINLNCAGWFKQQIIKIEAVKVVNDDYLILDSKNFFVKPTDLKYDIPEGTWHLNFDLWTDDFINFLRNEYKYEVPKYYYTQQTPFKIRKEVALKILNSVDMYEMFDICTNQKIWPSEFVIYLIFSDLRPNIINWEKYNANPIYHTWWWNNQLKISEFENIYNSSVEILGLHKNVWYHKNEKMQVLADWLCTKGLNKEYVYPATVYMDWGNTYLYDEKSPTL